MKLSVIGGGGIRSMFLAKSLTQAAKAIGITELVFMDNDAEKLKMFGGLAKEVARRIDQEVMFLLTTDAVLAVKDADYVITTIRVGQDEMRIRDERIALKYGVLGQETTGAGGFSMAMRTITALAGYCELIKKYAKPNVKVFNFSNPAGLVSQALRYLGYDFTFGICDAPSGLLHTIANMLNCSYEDFSTECYGLNHLSFFKSILLNGRDITQELLDNDETYQKTDMRYFEKKLTKHMGMLLNEYLYYYFYREKSVENIEKSGVTRGEMIKEINTQLLAELKHLDPQKDFEQCIAIFEKWYGRREDSYMANETSQGNGRKTFKFDIHSTEFGGYASVALSYIEALQTGKVSEMILCVPNDGAIAGLADDDTVEITCKIGPEGYSVKKIGEPNEIAFELIRRVKIYERLAAKAILTKDRTLAVDALMLHPLINSYSIAEKIVNDYIEANKPYSGEWK